MFALEDLKLFNEADMPKVKSAAARWSPPNLKSSPKIKIQVMYFLNNYIKKNKNSQPLAPMCETSAPSSKFRSE